MRPFLLAILLLIAFGIPASALAADEKTKEHDPEVVELLEKASSYLEEDEKQRQESVDKLVEMGARSVPYLCTRMNADNVMESIALVNALTRIGEDAVDELHKAYARETEEKARKLALKITAKIGSEKSFPVFREAAKDRLWAIRSCAAEGLGKIKTAESRELLSALLDDADDDVRLKALLSLADLLIAKEDGNGETGEKTAKLSDEERALIAGRIAGKLDDPSYIVRFGAAEVLADYGAPAVPILTEKLKSTDNLVVELLIIETLGNTGAEAAATVVRDYLEHDVHLIRAYAAIAYAKTGPLSDHLRFSPDATGERNPFVRKAHERASEIYAKRTGDQKKE